MSHTHLTEIISFIESIEIPIQAATLKEDTFLPGIKIHTGTLCYDPQQLIHPGDLLHEAGHIAVMNPKERKIISGNVAEFRAPAEDDEVAVLLWSYAALKKLELAPEVVFHQEGYKGDSEWLIQQFESRSYVGLPLLAWMGLCDEADFPTMKQWVRTA